MALRLRRGTDAERQLITPLQGELIYATDTKKLYVGDGATGGGVLVGPLDATDTDLVNDTSPQLGGDLDLNGNNITGNGNININGTITATGNINLGDANEDEITVAGTINSSLRPALDSSYDLGTQARRWQNISATGLTVDGQATVDRLEVRGNIEAADSTVLYDAASDSLAVSSIRATSIDGDLTGSVFSDDSALILVDAVSGSFSTSELSIQGSLIKGTDNVELEGRNLSIRGTSVDGTLQNTASVITTAVKLDSGTAIEPSPGDYLGGLAILTEFNADFDERSLFITAIDSVTGTATSPAKQELWLHNADGTLERMFSVNSRGVTESTGPFKMPTYTNDNERDTKISSPEIGMVIVNQQDDSSAVTKFQGYDGTSWVDLH